MWAVHFYTMPPTIPPIKTPIGWSKSAREYLEQHGLVAVVPCIRSSDYELIRTCPFRYYLRRRLGIAPILSWSPALSRGSWFHKRLEFFKLTSEAARVQMDRVLESRIAELKVVCETHGVRPTEADRIFDRERRDMMSAMGWFDATLDYEVPGYGRVYDFLCGPDMKVLASELLLVHYPKHKGGDPTPHVAVLDLLLYHVPQNVLWIVDFKTCSGSTITRLATCPLEFQTQHYLHITDALFRQELFHHEFKLPVDVRLGGMLHVAVQKPTISFGPNDRPFEEYEHQLTRGPRTGQVEVRRRYSGEPTYENYLARCRRWYFAEGEYAHKKPDRLDDPPVNISKTPRSLVLQNPHKTTYNNRLLMIRGMATRAAQPRNFDLFSASALRSGGKLSPYAPFYLCPIHQWPDIMAQEGFIVSHRDEDIPRKR